MGLISNAEKANTGTQIKQWFDNANSFIQNVASNKASIQAQLTAMKLNTVDYTADDCKEVQALIDSINTNIKTL